MSSLDFERDEPDQRLPTHYPPETRQQRIERMARERAALIDELAGVVGNAPRRVFLQKMISAREAWLMRNRGFVV